MPNLQQAAEALRRAHDIVADRIRANILRRNPRMSPEALDTLVEDETFRTLQEVPDSEEGFASTEWEADDSGWRPRERSPRIPDSRI